MFLSQIEKKMPGTTTGVVEPKRKVAPRAVRDWKPRLVQTEPEGKQPELEAPNLLEEVPMSEPEKTEPVLPPLVVVDDREPVVTKEPDPELEERVEALLNGPKTLTCGIRLPLELHAALKAEAKERKMALKHVALEWLLLEHKRRQMR